MSDLLELLERVKAAAGPDRELDAAITIALGDGPGEGWTLITQDKPGVFNMDAGRWINGCRIRTPKPFTASIDAALALVERKLPDFAYQLTNDYGGLNRVHINVAPGCEGFPPAGMNVSEDAETMPLAILVALLTALSLDTNKGDGV